MGGEGRAVMAEIEAEADPIIGEIEWPEPREGDENDDPLYDSARNYVAQINQYKAFQGKWEEIWNENEIEPEEDEA
jgi:hypothetical protein